MKRIIITIIFLIASLPYISAQTELPEGLTVDTYSDEFLDSLEIKKKLVINDYSMLGVMYGVNLSQVTWNPSQKQDMLIIPTNIGISYTKYGKMFGYMPYFGFQIGLQYTKEGYRFKYNEDKDYTYKIEGAEKAVYDILEMPLYMHCHYDLWNFKIIANAGCYVGYRLGIHRYPGKTGNVRPELEHSFTDYDRRWDYGLKGAVGFGLVFDPVEFHVMATYKHSFGTLYDPDYSSQYYYRYAYPMNIVISAGIHIHLSKRTGKSKADLRKAAKDIVYGTNQVTE